MIKNYMFIIFILFLFSCKKRLSVEEEKINRKKLIEKEKVQLEQERIQRVKNIENNDKIKNYKKKIDTIYSKKIYNQINDTIKKMIKFDYYFLNSYFKKRDILKLSKYIYFNTKEDKLIAFLITRTYSKCYYKNEDDIYFFIGEKINDGWWFYYDGKYIPERKEYSDNIKVPLPYELLEGIGIIRILNKYASEKDNHISDENFEKIKWNEERESYSRLIQKSN